MGFLRVECSCDRVCCWATLGRILIRLPFAVYSWGGIAWGRSWNVMWRLLWERVEIIITDMGMVDALYPSYYGTVNHHGSSPVPDFVPNNKLWTDVYSMDVGILSDVERKSLKRVSEKDFQFLPKGSLLLSTTSQGLIRNPCF